MDRPEGDTRRPKNGGLSVSCLVRHTIFLPDVLDFGQYLEVGFNMQAADRLTLKWVDMVDLVRDARLFG